MRELKFRWGFRGVGGNWHWLETMTLAEVAKTCEYSWADDVIVEQYTGLKDKNGVDIYEGDILAESHIGERVWQEHDGGGEIIDRPCGFVVWEPIGGINLIQCHVGGVKLKSGGETAVHLSRYDGQFEWYDWSNDPPCDREIEVIGNIHENGDLLEPGA